MKTREELLQYIGALKHEAEVWELEAKDLLVKNNTFSRYFERKQLKGMPALNHDVSLCSCLRKQLCKSERKSRPVVRRKKEGCKVSPIYLSVFPTTNFSDP